MTCLTRLMALETRLPAAEGGSEGMLELAACAKLAVLPSIFWTSQAICQEKKAAGISDWPFWEGVKKYGDHAFAPPRIT